MFSEINVMGCFATPIWLFKIENHEEFDRRLIEAIAKIHAEEKWDMQAALNTQGPRDHLQTREELHTRKEFAEFNQLAIGAVRQALERLQYRYDSFYITSCWANVSVRGYSHKEHAHPNNFLSGVYYPKAHPGCGTIVFDDPRPQAKVVLPDIKAPNIYNTHTFEVEPAPGRMILFPSWLTHRVKQNLTDEERISVAFNVMFKGTFGFERARASL